VILSFLSGAIKIFLFLKYFYIIYIFCIFVKKKYPLGRIYNISVGFIAAHIGQIKASGLSGEFFGFVSQ
jgi:lipoprotein signal peptidase